MDWKDNSKFTYCRSFLDVNRLNRVQLANESCRRSNVVMCPQASAIDVCVFLYT